MPLDTTFAPAQVDFSQLGELGQKLGDVVQQRRDQAALNSVLPKLMGANPDQAKSAIMSLMGTNPRVAQTASQIYNKLYPQLTPDAAQAHADRMLQLRVEYPWLVDQAQGTQGTPGVPQGTAPTEKPHPRSMGELAADKKYASGDYLTWLQGGFSETQQSLESLKHAKELLEKDDSLSGPIIGAMVKKSIAGQEDAMTVAARMWNPEAFNVAAAHQRAVVGSLRPLVGARAAQQLFQSIMQSTYDPSAPAKENARRLGLVYDNILRAAKAKQKMSEYFAKFQTLSGYTGPIFDPESFDPTEGVMEETKGGSQAAPSEKQALPKVGDVVDGHTYLGGNPNKPESWKEQ